MRRPWVHDPDALAFAEAGFDGVDDELDGGEVARVAGERLMRQRETITRDDEGDDDLLAVAAMIARVAALGEFIVLGEALEVAAGEIVQEKIVFELKERAEVLLEIVLDGNLRFEQLIERAIEAILGDRFIG